MKRYGIDELAVAALFEAQGGVCAICGVEGPTHVDHAHTSGQIRGLGVSRVTAAWGRPGTM
jgi:hypothetical protein